MNNVAQFRDEAAEARRKDDAEQLREYADRVEAGEIVEFVFVANDRAENVYERYASFSDRWRMLGALEYAKSAVYNAE